MLLILKDQSDILCDPAFDTDEVSQAVKQEVIITTKVIMTTSNLHVLKEPETDQRSLQHKNILVQYHSQIGSMQSYWLSAMAKRAVIHN